jgi:nitroreductase
MFFKLIETRRSIRKFTSRPVEKEKIDRLVEAALRAPSSRNFKPWRFIVVDDPALLNQLAGAKPHGASFLKNAPLGLVVCGDTQASDVWVEDCAIASTFIHLAAHDLGLGSCWIQIRKREHSPEKTADAYIKDLLGIPDPLSVESIIAIGYPDETKPGHAGHTLDRDKVSFNRFEKAMP